MPLVSVIIPVYNTEKFLHKCINSVLTQTLKDIEVLLINDGSTDDSGKICNEYAHKDKRVHVMHIQNQGVSHARNKGLEAAKGKYISFVDSDDWIDADMIEVLYQLIQTSHADLSTCGYVIEDENGNIIYKINEESTYILNKWDALSSLFDDKYYRYKGNLWDKLYNKDIIERNRLRFNEQIYYNEDRLFIFQYLNFCYSATYITIPYYHYIMRSSSAMNSYQKTYNKNMCTFMDAFDIMTSISGIFPSSVKCIMSIDYILSSISFFTRYTHDISVSEIWNRLMTMKKYNFKYLPVQLKIKCLLRCIKLLVYIKLKI